MKLVSTILFCTVAFNASAQDKKDYVHYNKLIDLKGTNYVIATVSRWGKMSVGGKYMLFINTQTGEQHQVEFPRFTYSDKIEQVKIDKLNLNKVLVSATTIDLDGKNGVDWNDPEQVIVFSTDGKQRVQITDDRLFVQAWTVNEETGHVVISGHYDTNNNGKYDKTDKSEIVIYDLVSMKVVSKT